MEKYEEESRSDLRNLFIQIPCLNEEKTLPLVIKTLPAQISGIDNIYLLVINDGSSDNTYKVASDIGVDFIINNKKTMGLAQSFKRGLETCLYLGADIIINIDGDNQYKGEDIRKLVQKIVEDKCDLVIGCRNIIQQREFNFIKKMFHLLGNRLVNLFCKSSITDITSGLRGITSAAAVNLHIKNEFSYTIEMIIQSLSFGMVIGKIDIMTNKKTRKSRLYKSNFSFILSQAKIIIHTSIFYYPTRFFSILSAIFCFLSLILATRIMYFLYLYPDLPSFKTGSGILLVIFILLAALCLIVVLLSFIFAGLRITVDDIRHRVRNIELNKKIKPSGFKIVIAKHFGKWKGFA